MTECDVLLVVADVLVMKALEAVGKRLVRVDRSRFASLNGLPLHAAHIRWVPDEATVGKALTNAWDVLPVVLSRHCQCAPPYRVAALLDGYVRDLCITGTTHTVDELALRLEAVNVPA